LAPTLVNDTITVTDTIDGEESELGSASDDTTFEYTHEFTCDDDEGSHWRGGRCKAYARITCKKAKEN
jgi:hypothetical protein